MYSDRGSEQSEQGIVVRNAASEDLVEAAQIYQSAAMALDERIRERNPWASPDARAVDLRAAIQALSGLAARRPDAVIVAEAANELAGMAAVRIRDRHAHIGFLFVLPEWQRKGVGTQLLERIREIIDSAGASTVTLIASRDAHAWQRYLRFGLHPGLPVLASRASTPRFPARAPTAGDDGLHAMSIERDSTDLLASVDALDAGIGGASRMTELLSWLDDGAEGSVVHDAENGEPRGYFLVSSHADHGRIGPVAARTVEQFPAILDRALHLAGTMRPARNLQWRLDLSAANIAAIDPLLDAGFSLQNLMPWFANGTIGQWDRYIFRDEDQL